MNTPYDPNYIPPFPVIPIRLYAALSDQFSEPLMALVDTGSDGSLVPLSILLAMKAKPASPAWFRWGNEKRRLVPTYLVDVYIGDRSYPSIQVVGDQAGHDVILGRDVLNQLPLFLDGIQQVSSILDDAAATRLRRQK